MVNCNTRTKILASIPDFLVSSNFQQRLSAFQPVTSVPSLLSYKHTVTESFWDLGVFSTLLEYLSKSLHLLGTPTYHIGFRFVGNVRRVIL
eukprot:4615426-Amphidinium_carterae.1